MELAKLFLLNKKMPLSEVIAEIDREAYLGKWLYRLGGGLYLYLSSSGKGYPGEPAGPYIHGLYCSPDDSAILRVVARNIEADLGMKLEPPVGFFPTVLTLEYQKIIDWARSQKFGFYMESASYRIASDGKFVQKKIETEKFTFYFRNSGSDDFEKPYVILYKF